VSDPATLAAFDRLAPLLTPALVYAGGWTVADVRARVASGLMQLWAGDRSVLITQLEQAPRWKELHFFSAAGHLDELRRLYDAAMAWGRLQGCRRATILGRPGWERTFLTREEGWTTRLQLFEKHLPPPAQLASPGLPIGGAVAAGTVR
jgi:hypothetical protein